MRIAIALALTVVALSARAGPAEEERAMALQLAQRDAEEAQQRGDFARCAAGYLRAFDIDSRAIGDLLLYNAGVCFDSDAEVNRALEAWRRMSRRSVLRSHALARMANLLERVARYEEAAEALEQFADAAPRDPMTPDALERAAFFRAALGQNRRAIRLVERWLRAGTHRREEIAQGKAWIARLRARPPPPPPAPKRLPERYDRRGVAGDMLVTAPLAP